MHGQSAYATPDAQADVLTTTLDPSNPGFGRQAQNGHALDGPEGFVSARCCKQHGRQSTAPRLRWDAKQVYIAEHSNAVVSSTVFSV